MQSKPRVALRNLLAMTAAVAAAAGCASYASSDKPAIAAPAAPAMSQTAPTELVDALNGVFGKHAARGSHAKGFCFAGQLEAAPGAAALTRAAMFQPGKRTPVIGRFSIGGGNPKAPDNAKSVRGIAVRASDGKEQLDWVFISAPHFFAQTPEQFVNFFKVRAPDPATGKMNPEAIAAFSKANPATTRQAGYIASQPVPASYATVPYWSTNTFMATNTSGKAQALRWRFEPAAGRVGLSDDEAKAKGHRFPARGTDRASRQGSGGVQRRGAAGAIGGPAQRPDRAVAGGSPGSRVRPAGRRAPPPTRRAIAKRSCRRRCRPGSRRAPTRFSRRVPVRTACRLAGG